MGVEQCVVCGLRKRICGQGGVCGVVGGLIVDLGDDWFSIWLYMAWGCVMEMIDGRGWVEGAFENGKTLIVFFAAIWRSPDL